MLFFILDFTFHYFILLANRIEGYNEKMCYRLQYFFNFLFVSLCVSKLSQYPLNNNIKDIFHCIIKDENGCPSSIGVPGRTDIFNLHFTKLLVNIHSFIKLIHKNICGRAIKIYFPDLKNRTLATFRIEIIEKDPCIQTNKNR